MLTPSNPTLTSPTTAERTTLAAVLQADPVSCEILRFFLKNESAMDSAKGIAAWWIHRDELAVQPSLHRLFACGAVLAHTLTSGVTLYKLTQDPELRAWLQNALGVADDRRINTEAPVKQGNA
ncbi:MAG: hypothetical protein H6Q33_4610 [Deltaproteobacteria bacterium]|nr:hypothetical protein [Deltaproteobacteria bacterium]